jgi:hypothetical protein
MKRMIIGALVTTGMVLATIYVLNQLPFTRQYVAKALSGA